MYESKFAYVPFDSIAALEQNALRDAFMKVESRINKGEYIDLMAMVSKFSEYGEVAQQFATNAHLIVWDTDAHKLAALHWADMLYSALGKDIRERCIMRLRTAL
jgi:hypothetical protein